MAVTGAGTVEAASLFCEATGRDVGGGDGLGAAAFWWSVVVEDSLAVSPDFDAAASAIARIDQGTRRGGICRAMTEDLRLACAGINCIELMEYTLSVTVKKVPALD